MNSTDRKHVRGVIALAVILIGVVSLTFALTGCADPKPGVRGVVVDKDYDAPVRKSGKRPGKPADYDITVRPDGAPVDGSEDIEIDVTRKKYNDYKIGDRYPKK